MNTQNGFPLEVFMILQPLTGTAGPQSFRQGPGWQGKTVFGILWKGVQCAFASL